MKSLRILLCLMLILTICPAAALCERYYEALDCGVTFDFEIDEKLLQPLDIFDIVPILPSVNTTDEDIATGKALLQKAIDLIYPSEGLGIHEDTDNLGFYSLDTYKDKMSDGFCGSLTSLYLTLLDGDCHEQYYHLPERLYNAATWEFGEVDYPVTLEECQIDHDFMTHEEADEQTRALLMQLSPEDTPFEPVLSYWYSFSHDQLSDLLDWKLENDDPYYTDEEIFGNFAGEEWTEDYDGYWLEYTYTYKGYPVCDGRQTIYGGTVGEPVHPQGLSTSCMIDRTGYATFSNPICFTCDYTPYEDIQTLTLYEALDVVRKYLEGITWLNPLTIDRVYVEYLYLSTDDLSPESYEPIWNFVSNMKTKYGTMENYQVYRVNARTGEIMTNGTGVIEE